MKPLSLSDAELDVIFNLARPLEPLMRDAFLRAVALELGRYAPEALGPGLVNRVGRQLQREFFQHPATQEFISKYER